jgi:hypothetical protein
MRTRIRIHAETKLFSHARLVTRWLFACDIL